MTLLARTTHAPIAPNRGHRAVTLVCILSATILTLLGCSAPRTEPTEPASSIPLAVDRARPPADLTISVTVLAERSNSGQWPTLAPSRFIIEPDGLLRVGIGEGAGRRYYPTRTRRLTSAQVGSIYERIVREGLDLRASGIDLDTLAGPATTFAGPARAAPGQSLVVVTLIAHDRRTVAVHDADESPRAAALVAQLRRLARLDQS